MQGTTAALLCAALLSLLLPHGVRGQSSGGLSGASCPCQSRHVCVNSLGVCDVCSQGDYCPGGTNISVVCENKCPAGLYCPSPLEIYGCPAGSYCPAGSTSPTACEDGYTYCAANSSVSGDCPQGFYCPTPGELIVCPAGSYCPEAVTSPRACPLLVDCAEGTSSPTFAALGLVLVAVMVFGIVGSIIAHIIYQKMVERELALKTTSQNKIKAAARAILHRLGGAEISLPYRGFSKKDEAVTVGFENISLHLKSGQCIIKNITGKFAAGTMTSVMGPSGCGKTSFLASLAGRAHYAVPGGTIYINGRESDRLQSISAFVPQDDIMHEGLTSRENITYQAKLRLPADTPAEVRERMVTDTLAVLGIEYVQHEIVGGVKKRGISGGQKKRVNVGMELVSNPSVLFLDEPTSGLDSASAQDLVQALGGLAEQGLTIVMVIHQPRSSTFELFDQLMLLSKEGEIVYLGPTDEALIYFASLGFEMKEANNPADFLMDVISGIVSNEKYPFIQPTDFPELWARHLKGQPVEEFEHSRTVATYEQSTTRTVHTEHKHGVGGIELSLIPSSDIKSKGQAAEHSSKPERGGKSGDDLPMISEVKSSSTPTLSIKLVPDSTADAKEPDQEDVAPGDYFRKHINEFTSDPTGNTFSRQDMKHLLQALNIETNNDVLEGVLEFFEADAHGTVSVSVVLGYLEQKETVEELMSIQTASRSAFPSRGARFAAPDANEVGKEQSAGQPDTVEFVSFPRQLLLFMQRAVLMRARQPLVLALDLSFVVCGSLAVSITFGSGWGVDQMAMIFGTLPVLLAVNGGVAALAYFHDERLTYLREAATGISPTAYFLAQNIVALLDIFFRSALYVSCIMAFMLPQMEYWELLVVMLGVAWYAHGLAYIFAVTQDLRTSTLVVAMLGVFLGLISGNLPNYAELKKSEVLLVIANISYARFALEALLGREMTAAYSGRYFFEEKYIKWGFEPDVFGYDVGMLIALGSGFRLVAYVLFMREWTKLTQS